MKFTPRKEWIGSVITDFDGDLARIIGISKSKSQDEGYIDVMLLKCNCSGKHPLTYRSKPTTYHIWSDIEDDDWSFYIPIIEEQPDLADLYEV